MHNLQIKNYTALLPEIPAFVVTVNGNIEPNPALNYVIITYEDDYLVCVPFIKVEYYKNIGKQIKNISIFENIEKAYKAFVPLVQIFYKNKNS